MSLERQNFRQICTTRSRARDPLFHKKSLRFPANQKTALKAPVKQEKSIPKFFQNDSHEKSISAIPSSRKRRFGSPKRRTFELEIDKKRLGNKPKNKKIFYTFRAPKMTETSPEITPKSTKILLFATSCPSCCSHGPPPWSRGAKMASQGATETPK